MNDPIAPARPSPRFARFFGAYARRMLRRNFASVRLEQQSDPVLRGAASHAGPLIIAFNHPSWWDPIVGIVVKQEFMPDRPALASIEMAMFDRFRFMRRLGMFGIEPDHPDALRALTRYVADRVAENPRTALLLTPQGGFTDVRAPVVIRPGAGSVASALPDPRVITLVSELVFWHDRRPELLMMARPCPPPRHPTTAGWTRAIRDAMQDAASDLASRSVARDEAAFRPLFTKAGSDINPIYDAWQRLCGRSSRVTPARRGVDG